MELINETFQAENSCNLIENICINEIRSFIETQKERKLSGVSWNDLIENFSLDSVEIDESLNPCVVFLRYEKLSHEISSFQLLDIAEAFGGIALAPFCSYKSLICMEGAHTWDNVYY